jgi:hypothetical protein
LDSGITEALFFVALNQRLFLDGGVFLEQIYRTVGEFDEMRMRAIAVCQYGESELAITIPSKKAV